MLKEQNQTKPKPKRGGYRPGGGRPKGSLNKASWRDLLMEFETQMGQGFVTTVVENYIDARTRQDWSTVCVYDRAILNKLAPDLHHIEVKTDEVESKARAFAEAMAALQTHTSRVTLIK